MKKVPSTTVKNRSRELTSVFEAFQPYNGMEGRVERIWITDIATDRVHLVSLTASDFINETLRFSPSSWYLIENLLSYCLVVSY